jgi:hypothetical protein
MQTGAGDRRDQLGPSLRQAAGSYGEGDPLEQAMERSQPSTYAAA